MKILFFLHLFIFCHRVMAMQESKQIVMFHEDAASWSHPEIVVNITSVVPEISPVAKTDLTGRLARTMTASDSSNTKVRLAMIAACLSVIGSAVTLIIHFTDC